jgi:hypothetical protein
MPYRGSKVKKRRGVLKLIHGNYLIYYRLNEDKKTVERENKGLFRKVSAFGCKDG